MKDLRTAWERMQARFASYAKAREAFGKELEACLQTVAKDIELLPHWEEVWHEPLFFRRELPGGRHPLGEIVNAIFETYIVEGGEARLTDEEKGKLEELLAKLGFRRRYD